MLYFTRMPSNLSAISEVIAVRHRPSIRREQTDILAIFTILAVWKRGMFDQIDRIEARFQYRFMNSSLVALSNSRRPTCFPTRRDKVSASSERYSYT